MKDKILTELKNSGEEFVSGEVLSTALGVTRTAVWKYIRELRQEGYGIESSSKKGYRLLHTPDAVNSSEIGHGLGTRVLGREIHCFEVIDSTNNYAKKAAAEGCSDGTLVVAECQTAGRGRLGRPWESSDKKGIWMSIVLKPCISPEEVQVITIAAAVAVVDAIYKATGIETGIKWPNDILLEGKKVCGILTEMSCEMERVNFLVIGMGINVNQDGEDFPEELRNTAISLKMHGGVEGILRRSEIIKQILYEMEKQYDKIKMGKTDEIIEEWKKKSVTLGKLVRANIRNTEITGTAVDITEDGKLVVKSADGEELEVLSGEVSVRGLLGYV